MPPLAKSVRTRPLGSQDEVDGLLACYRSLPARFAPSKIRRYSSTRYAQGAVAEPAAGRDGERSSISGRGRDNDVVSIPRVRLLRTRLFGEDGPRTVGQFVRAVLVLALCLYFLRNGVDVWQAVVLAAVFGGAAILVRTLMERNRQKRS